MSTPAEVRLARRVLRHELEAIRGHWAWFLTLGIVLIIVGTIAVGMPFVASLATAVTFGALLLVGGIAQLIGAFWTRDWSGFFLSLLMGVLYFVLGLFFVRDPGDALLAMTLLLACMLMVGGLFRIIGSVMYKFQQWPVSGLWVIGLFVGIDLIFTGWTWVMLALAVKNVQPPTTISHTTPE